MTDIGLVLTVAFCLAVLALPRVYAAMAFLSAALYITQGQCLDVGGINMTAIRFVEVAAGFRVAVRRDIGSLSLAEPDRWLVLFFLSYTVVTLLRCGTLDMYTIGSTVDGLLVYSVFRALIRTPEDFIRLMRGMVVLLIPFASFMLEEAITGRNLFSSMGGVPDTPVWRDGHYRCQGSFRHAITAGTVGATFLPLFVGFLVREEKKWWAVSGVVASLGIITTSHSSGPIMTTFIATAAWGCWFLRYRMKWVRRGIVCAVLGLHLMMKAPVWFIFDRISGIIGGGGWHRANLIDKFIKSFEEWWLIGMPMEKTESWAATVLPNTGYVDVTNYYVSIGINGGLISLAFFVMMLIACFRAIGLAMRSIRVDGSKSSGSEPVLWGMASALVAHSVNLTAVSYWDQSYVIWYLHLAMAVTICKYLVVHSFGSPEGVETSAKYRHLSTVEHAHDG